MSSREQLFKLHREIVEKAFEIMKAKNKDYSPDEDPLTNVRLCERMGICSAETGVLVRMCDKFQRLANLIKRGGEAAVADEKVIDTAIDLINYMVIEMCLYSEKQDASK